MAFLRPGNNQSQACQQGTDNKRPKRVVNWEEVSPPKWFREYSRALCTLGGAIMIIWQSCNTSNKRLIQYSLTMFSLCCNELICLNFAGGKLLKSIWSNWVIHIRQIIYIIPKVLGHLTYNGERIILKISAHRVSKPAHLVPVPSQDKLGGLCKEGHPA